MIHINLTKQNTSLVIPFKSGHSVLYATFLNLFKVMNIDYEIVNDPSNKMENVFIFTRNPIERFFSGYFWLISSDKEYESLNEKYNIPNLQSYISNYLRFINNEVNLHYLPQSAQILTKDLGSPLDVNLFMNHRKKYDDCFRGNYKIFRIEDITSVVNSNYDNMIAKKVGIYPKVKLIEDVEFKKFPFLEMFSVDVNLLFMSFYEMFMKYNELSYHHKNTNYYSQVSLQEYNQVFNYFQYELNWFGYEKDDDVVKKLAKSIV
jgi:hypothetical protein